MKVFLLIRDDIPLKPENLLLVGRKEDAERLINDGYATYYEVIEVLDGLAVNEFYKNGIIGRG